MSPAGRVPEDLTGMHRILLDGGSGSGKSTFAARLAAQWADQLGRPVQLVGLDDVYPGWHGLADAARAVPQEILRDRGPGYRRWDWERDRPAEWVSLDPEAPLLVEGCGALTPESRALADLGIWLAMPAARRKARALARDGEGYAPWWDTWAGQEACHWRRHHPRQLADVVLHP